VVSNGHDHRAATQRATRGSRRGARSSTYVEVVSQTTDVRRNRRQCETMRWRCRSGNLSLPESAHVLTQEQGIVTRNGARLGILQLEDCPDVFTAIGATSQALGAQHDPGTV